jgi:hypothetical protein
MNNAKKVKTLAAAFAVLFLMNSCADFFSTTWGDFFKRDPKNVKVTASNVYDLLDTAKGDPELSKAILDKIYTTVKSGDKSADADTLRRAAIKAANQTAGISTVALENVKGLIDAVDSNDKEKALKEVANKILKDLGNNDIVGIAEKMTEILAAERTFTTVSPSVALKSAGSVTVPVTKIGDTSPSTITIDTNANGTGTATISVGGVPVKTYPCVINDNGTITLSGAGENYWESVDIKYELNNNKQLILSDLDKIKDPDAGLGQGQGLAGNSSPSVEPLDDTKYGFNEQFLDSVPESDLTLLAMTLILAKADVETKKDPNSTLDTYLDTWFNKSLETGKGLEDDEILIVAIINEMIDRGEDTSELTNMIKDLLGVK